MQFLPLILVLFSIAPGSASEAQLPLNATLSLEHTIPDTLQHDDASLLSRSSPRLIMYVQTFSDTSGNPLSLLPLLEQKTRVTHIIIGSIHLHEEPGKIMLNNDPMDSPIYNKIWKEMKILQDNGIKVMALLGGAAGGTYKRLSGSDESFQSYYQPLLVLLKEYAFDGLDIDIEEKVSVSVPLRLLHALYDDLGPTFIRTLAPFCTALSEEDDPANFSGFSYFALETLALIPNTNISLISWYNGQFYGVYSRTNWLYKSIISKGPWDPERVVMSVMTSKGEVANDFVEIKKLEKVITGLRKEYGAAFGGVAGWEYWDAGSSDKDLMVGKGNGGEPWRWVKRIAGILVDDLSGEDKTQSTLNGAVGQSN